ncbi:cilia- and flagella-associated protein 68-like [Ciona intestinalis]
MALQENNKSPSFRYGVRASGLGEVWTHTHDQLKFTQFGWRCTTKESSYSNKTLIGNWNEQRYEVNRALELKPLLSQYDHYFETTSSQDYRHSGEPVGLDNVSKKADLRKLAGKEPTAFPGHQPELDHDLDKEMYNSFITTSRTAYVHPTVRKTPQV